MIRRKEREFALKVLYALEYSDSSFEIQFGYLKQKDKKHGTEFAYNLVQTCVSNQQNLDEQIVKKLQHWDYSRVAVIDKLLLRMALTEFLYFEEIPPEVTLDEIIEISKDYSTDKSDDFINGVLDALLKQLINDKKIKKSGRGLVSKITQ